MNRGQMQYKMRGRMMRAARRNAMRGHRASSYSGSSPGGDGMGLVVLLIIGAVPVFLIVNAFGVVGWAVFFLFALPVMAGWLVHLAQRSGAPAETITPTSVDSTTSTPPKITTPNTSVTATPLASQAANATPFLHPRSRQSYIYRPRTQYVRGHSRITKDGRVVQVKGHLRSHR